MRTFILSLLFLVLLVGGNATFARETKKRAKTVEVEEASAKEDSSGGYDINPMFGYTHMQPSPYTLSSGRLILGTYVAYGVLDFLQVGTNIIQDFYKVYNASAKLSLLKFQSFAAAITGGWEHYNYKDLHPLNPDATVTVLQPGVVTAYGLLDTVALFIGGNLQYTKDTIAKNIEKSGYVQGARAGADLSWAYNPPKGKNVGNVLSAGATYDITYKMLGYGVSHHFPGFQLGVHYYPSATRQKYLPIIAGGAVVDL